MLGFVVVGTLVVCLCACSVRADTARELKCLVPKVTAVKLSINSQRNQTGHWISKYELKHGEDTKTPMSIQMEVEQKTSICENEEAVGITATITATPYKAALPGYELFPGLGYYKFHPNMTTWQVAHDACLREGAHLAMTNSEKEANVYQIMFARYPQIIGAGAEVNNNHAWLGFCEIGTNGKYFTLSGDSIKQDEFYRWSLGEPNNGGGFDCLLVNRITGGFADAPRDFIGAFICEQEL